VYSNILVTMHVHRTPYDHSVTHQICGRFTMQHQLPYPVYIMHGHFPTGWMHKCFQHETFCKYLLSAWKDLISWYTVEYRLLRWYKMAVFALYHFGFLVNLLGWKVTILNEVFISGIQYLLDRGSGKLVVHIGYCMSCSFRRSCSMAEWWG